MNRCECCEIPVARNEGWQLATALRAFKLCDHCFEHCMRDGQTGEWMHDSR